MTHLERRTLGDTGLEVTRIGLGALEIGRDWGIGDGAQRTRPSDEQADATLNGVLDLGINLIDTARAYHRSEERIGRYVANRRGDYVLTTKCGEHSDEPRTFYDFGYDAIRQSIETSLELLHTDVIDVLQIHFGPNPAQVLDDGETVRAMLDAREAGKVRFLGASAPNDLLDRCIDCGVFQVLQVGYSLLDRGAHDAIMRAHDRGIGILIRSGLAGGWLTPRVASVPEADRPEPIRRLLKLVGGDASRLHSLALGFLKEHPGITSILVGSRNVERFRASVYRFEEPVDTELLRCAMEVTA